MDNSLPAIVRQLEDAQAFQLGERILRNSSMDVIKMKDLAQAVALKGFLSDQSGKPLGDISHTLIARDACTGLIINIWNVHGTDVRLDYTTGPSPRSSIGLAGRRIGFPSDTGNMILPVYLSVYEREIGKREGTINYLKSGITGGLR